MSDRPRTGLRQHVSAITLRPDASAFVGVLAGIVRISDTS